MANTAKIKTITMAVAICSATLAIAPSAHAQGLVQGSLNQLFNNIQQEIASGLMTPGQVNDIMRREANLQAEQQNLLMADGGVLTPNDQAKLFRDMQKLAQRTQNNMVNNGYAGACNNRYDTAWNNGYHNGWREEARREHRRMERVERRTGIDFDHDGH